MLRMGALPTQKAPGIHERFASGLSRDPLPLEPPARRAGEGQPRRTSEGRLPGRFRLP